MLLLCFSENDYIRYLVDCSFWSLMDNKFCKANEIGLHFRWICLHASMDPDGDQRRTGSAK
jgi:hypothetical protein